jgi:xanthine dehydrogenase accessory factor
MMNLFKSMAQLLASGESLVLATIVSRSGSAPRVVGTRMIIRQNASIVGTIGGGLLEAQVQELAREVFAHRRSVLREFLFTAEEAARMSMICGGQVQVLIHYVDTSVPFNRELYQEILTTLDFRKRAWLITAMPSDGDSSEPPVQLLRRSDGTHVGHLAPLAVRVLTDQAGAGMPGLIEYQGQRFLVESLCHQGTLFIFGAGHVAQKLAPLARLVGFYTVVLDDRPEFANQERFDSADEIIVLGSFEQAVNGLEINEDGYLVLVTRGHAHDHTVLRQALGTRAGYIGMIGSRRKRDAIYAALGKEGFSREQLDRVHSPIGLNIGAETPEEIAVSIVAELIQVRAERHR